METAIPVSSSYVSVLIRVLVYFPYLRNTEGYYQKKKASVTGAQWQAGRQLLKSCSYKWVPALGRPDRYHVLMKRSGQLRAGQQEAGHVHRHHSLRAASFGPLLCPLIVIHQTRSNFFRALFK